MKTKKLLSLLAVSMMLLVGCTSGGGKSSSHDHSSDHSDSTCEHTYVFVSDVEQGHHEEC